MLKLKLGNTVEDVLLRALDPPSSINIQRAIASLVEVKALTPAEEITPMGRLLSKLPMDVHLGKFLLVAALFKCLDPALTIAATLNSKSPFVTPFGFEGAADAAKKGFAIGQQDIRQFCSLTLIGVQGIATFLPLRMCSLAGGERRRMSASSGSSASAILSRSR